MFKKILFYNFHTIIHLSNMVQIIYYLYILSNFNMRIEEVERKEIVILNF